MKDPIYFTLKKRFNDIYAVDPSDLESPYLTNIYKWLTGPIKTFPFRLIIPLSLILSIVAYVILGLLIVKLATLLQSGF